MQYGKARGPRIPEEEKADARPKQRGQDPVREVLAHAFHTGAGHAVGVEAVGIAAHYHGNGLARAFEVALGKRDGDAQGVFVKAPGRDADPDDDGRDEPCRPGVGVNLRGPRQPAREGGTGQDDKQTGESAGEGHQSVVGTAPEQGFDAGGQRAHHADGMHAGRQFPEKTVDQQRGGQQREEGEIHFNSMLW